MSKHYKEALFVAFIAFLGLVSLYARTDRLNYLHPSFEEVWDHHKYIEMAAHNPFGLHIAPFGWRILNPILAKILPFEISKNFTILTLVELWFTAVITYYMSRKFGLSRGLALAG